VSELNKYQILNLVAKGGTAVLYRAVQTSLDRVVAVKKLHQHLTEDENFTRRFILEAKAAASLDHENIVKIIDFGTDDDGYHMVMEFIEGESFRGILDKWKQLPPDIALAVAYRVCQGLEHAHAKGIVHRDIKPGNVMLTRNGRIKITDFGLAKLTQQTTQHTAANSILGTPLYMSPEQAFGESVDQRSDLFSLGTMLYEMITGIQPFRDEHYMGVIQNIINKNAPHPSKFDVEMPVDVQSILSKSMNKSREARFQSAGQFKKAIEKVLGLRILKESQESLRQLLNTDGETLILPRTLVSQKRRRRIRRGFVTALVTTMVFGAAGMGYTLAPERVHDEAQNVVSWFENAIESRTQTRPEMNASNTMGAADAYLSTLVPDSTSANPSGDHSSVISDTAAVVPPPAGAEVAATQAALATTKPDSTPVKTTPIYPPTVAVPPTPTQPVQTPEPEPVEKPVQVRKGWLSITATPSVDVYIDGMYRGDASPGLQVELTSGRHRLECEKPGHVKYEETVHITAGEFSTRRILLKKLQGRLNISTMAGAEVYVDGKLIGVTPLRKALELDAGTHQVTVKKAGFNVWSNQITVNGDETLPLSIILSPLY